MENARLLFKNFAGREGMYNREGDRNFCVELDEDLAQQMLADGWNVKRLKPREESKNPEGDAYIQVTVGFKGNRPPKMVLISSQGRNELGEEFCEMFDWIDVKKADLIIRPYEWNVNGKSGVKAYLKSLFITQEEDYLELKYSDVPEAGAIEAPTAPLELNRGSKEYDETNDIVDAEIVEDEAENAPWDQD
jgi:hypothetical protein